ncbi:MAG TPA: hypothetical protein VGG39_29610 [Polyangiaceae bacterium]|jgi:hypothetical protein
MSDPHAPPVDDEPKSPLWLPALGAALFVGAGLWWAVTPSAAAVAPEPSASESAAPAARPVAAAPNPAPTAPMAVGSAGRGPHFVPMPGASNQMLQQMLHDRRLGGGRPPVPPGHP